MMDYIFVSRHQLTVNCRITVLCIEYVIPSKSIEESYDNNMVTLETTISGYDWYMDEMGKAVAKRLEG